MNTHHERPAAASAGTSEGSGSAGASEGSGSEWALGGSGSGEEEQRPP